VVLHPLKDDDPAIWAPDGLITDIEQVRDAHGRDLFLKELFDRSFD
jgi:hypothetical protein